MGQFDQLLSGIQKQTNIDLGRLIKVSGLVLQTNLKDAKQVRGLVQKSSQILGIPITKQKEQYLVKTITSNKIPKDPGTLIKLIRGK